MNRITVKPTGQAVYIIVECPQCSWATSSVNRTIHQASEGMEAGLRKQQTKQSEVA